MNTNYQFHSGSSSGKSLMVVVLLLVAGVAFLYFYDKEKSHMPALKVVPQKTETKSDNAAGLPKGQMEDGPSLEDLPALPNVPVPIKKTELIKVETLHAGDSIQSPLTVSGQARGNWFFEASFPIKIIDKNGKIIGQGNGQAEGEWMTGNFAPWKAVISFIAPVSGKGEVVFMKDNPSGLPEHDVEVRVPVIFAHPQ